MVRLKLIQIALSYDMFITHKKNFCCFLVLSVALIAFSQARQERVRAYFEQHSSAYWEALVIYYDIEAFFVS